MGIYSSRAAELLKEFDVQPDPNALGLLEFAVSTKESEQAMFDTMLEMDFYEAYSEHGQLVITEGEKAEGLKAAAKGIWNKIVKMIETAIQTIMNFLGKIKNTLAEKLKVDAGLAKKYGKLTVADINLSEKQKSKEYTVFKFTNNLKTQGPLGKSLKALEFVNKDSDLSAVTEDMVKRLENLASGTSVDDFKIFFEKKAMKDIGQTELDKAYEAVSSGYKSFVNDLTEGGNDAIKVLKSLRSKALKKMNADTAEDRASGSKAYTLINKAVGFTTKSLNFTANVATKAMSSWRSIYVAFGVAAKGKAAEVKKEEEKTGEAAPEEVKEEAAMYDELLEYAFEVATDNIFDEITFA